jgi:hypothetical protein
VDIDYGPSGPFPIFSAGVDWLTCTAPYGPRMCDLEHWGDDWLRQEKRAGRDVTSSSRLGYVGRQAEHCFMGRNDQGLMCQLSGPCAAYAAMEVIPLAANVSRLDLQVTLFCGLQRPNIAEIHWNQLKAKPRTKGRPFAFAFTQKRPTGQMLTINSRRSDVYMRIYDKAAESKLGPPLSLWRLEAELKRKAAKRWAEVLVSCQRPDLCATNCIRAVTHSKGLDPLWICPSNLIAWERTVTKPSRDVLAWLNSSVRITVQKAINKYGRQMVLEALGLDQKQPEEANENNDLP